MSAWEPLFDACKHNDAEKTLNLIKSNSVDVKQPNKNKKGFSPLHIACIYNSLNVAKILVKYGADVNAENNGTTIIHSAAKKGHYLMAAFLIGAGANVSVVDNHGFTPIQICALQEAPNNDLFMLFYLCNFSDDGSKSSQQDSKDIGLKNVGIYGLNLDVVNSLGLQNAPTQQKLSAMLEKTEVLVTKLSGQKILDLNNKALPKFAPANCFDFSKLKSLDLSHNRLTKFPPQILSMASLTHLDLSYNKISDIPPKLTEIAPKLTWKSCNISFNKLNVVPPELLDIPNIDLRRNPITAVPEMFREDNSKIIFYLRYGGKTLPWDQVKVMLVGHEGVGKTTFLKSLQGQAYKINVSTNGVDIATVEMPASSPRPEGTIFSKGSHHQKRPKVTLSVWDFGGQAVFHNTHRFFLTSSAIYLVVYNMADEQTHSRLQHWMHQIQSIIDSPGNSMPILIVGTHADKLSAAEQEQVRKKIDQLYPKSRSNTGVQGHFTTNLSKSSDSGLVELKEKINEIATTHAKIGIQHVQVPSFLILLKDKLEQFKKERKYLYWTEYEELFKEVVNNADCPIVDWTMILQDLGVLVWNNTSQLRDIVIINPQWLADALAGVVTMVNQESIARAGGVALRSKLYNVLQTKIQDVAMYPTIFGLLEKFEIILRLRNYYAGINSLLEEDVKYFVPSLLLPYNPKKDLPHPAMQFWTRLHQKPGYLMLKRRFTWTFFPANFFPRLLLRLMHMQVSLLGSWVDAALIMSSNQEHFGFLHLFMKDGDFLLEVTVLHHLQGGDERDSLISELAYTITRLDRDMWEDTPVKHEVIVCIRPENPARADDEENEAPLPAVTELPVLFMDCIYEASKKNATMRIGEHEVSLAVIAPDLTSCNEITRESLLEMTQIGEGGFGVIYKSYLKESNVPVAVKEMKRNNYEEDPSESLKKLYEFQHEMLIMSKVQHKNLVTLFGVLHLPLSLVMEFIPCGDLYHQLSSRKKVSALTFKWRLKMAIDIAAGMSHLHKQNPPICHSDLRAPNIFITSLDDSALVVGKVADFGLAQQVQGFSVQVLGNVTETAPETWGDEGATKGAMYDERADVFSYAIILWRLFSDTIPRPPLPISNSSSVLKPALTKPPPSVPRFSSPPGSSSSPAPSPPLVPPRFSSPPVLNSSSSSLLPPSNLDEDELEPDPYYHLRDSKGRLNQWTLRTQIRQGERPIIKSACHPDIAKLMESCWQSDPTLRPFSPFITQRLREIYKSMYGEDDYLSNSSPGTTILEEQLTALSVAPKDELNLENWYPMPELHEKNFEVFSLVLADDYLWAGTNTGAILIVNPKSNRQGDTLKKLENTLYPSKSRGS